MSQWIQSVIDSPVVKKLLGVAGVAEPVRLDRINGSETSFIVGNVLVGSAGDTTLLPTVLSTLADSEAKVYYPINSAERFDIEKMAEKAKASVNAYQQDIDKDLRFKGLVFDATAIESSDQLDALYTFFHGVIRRLAPCARLLVLGRQPESITEPKHATAQRALEGFTRCLGKEIGKKGCTVQLAYVAKGAEKALVSPLQFVLSPRSAYVSAQVLRVDNNGKVPVVDWKKPLEGKVALVTGASRGIGEKIAEVMARDGATVVGLDIPQAEGELRGVMHRLGGKALPMDITAADAPKAISDWLKEEFGGVDVIVHNAGVTRDKTLGGMPEHFWNMVIDINLSSEERINDQLLADKMIRDGGRIVCVSSVSGIAGNFGQTNYGASKAGVVGMIQSMAPVLKKQNITINAVAPGFIETQMTAAIPVMVREVGKRINALGQPGMPQDVAEAIAFFASPASAGVSGNLIRVCGQSMLGA